MTREIVILGATGSIGRSALDVIAGLGDGFHVAAVTAHSSWEELAAIARRVRPHVAVMGDPRFHAALAGALAGLDIEVKSGPAGLEYAAALKGADTVLTGIVGGAGLKATLAAVEAGKRLGVANKEPFVMAGRLISRRARATGCEIIPVDSEHSAIFQCLRGADAAEVHRLYLTGSGGPFRTRPAADLARVTPAEALNHPTWSMGPKITVDSATMMNKALELIEARWLFGVAPDKIEVIVHPQSIVHSMVAFQDGNILAQLGPPDMRLPIQYALTYPRRVPGQRAHIDLAAVGTLSFERPDLDKYPALRMGYAALRADGDTPGIIINAANEVAVERFLAGRLPFTGIATAVAQALDRFAADAQLDLEGILDLDRRVRESVVKEYP